MPETASLAHTGCTRVQQESPDPQVHDLGGGLQGNGNPGPGLLLGSSNHYSPPVPLFPLALERVLEQQIEAILICPGWKGAMWWPQLVELRTESAPIRLPMKQRITLVTLGKHRGTPQLGSTIRFSHQWESRLVSGGKDPEVLSEADHAFIIRTISGMTPLNLMEPGGTGSRSSVRDSE